MSKRVFFLYTIGLTLSCHRLSIWEESPCHDWRRSSLLWMLQNWMTIFCAFSSLFNLHALELL